MSAFNTIKFGEKRTITKRLSPGDKVITKEGITYIEEPCLIDVEEVFVKDEHFRNSAYWEEHTQLVHTLRPIPPKPPPPPKPPSYWSRFWAWLFRKPLTLPKAQVVKLPSPNP